MSVALRRWAAAGCTVVVAVAATPWGPAGAQPADTVAPVALPATEAAPVDPAATTTTISTTTTTACIEPQPQFPFVGQVIGRDGDAVTFGVLAAPEGSPLPPTVPVLFPDEARYLDDGGRYAVVAFGPDPAVEVEGAAPAVTAAADPAAPVTPAVLPAVLQGRVKLDGEECGALTRHEDLREVDTAVLKPLFENWRRLAWSVVVPVLAAIAVLTLVVAAKRLATRMVFGPQGARVPTGRRPRRPERTAGP